MKARLASRHIAIVLIASSLLSIAACSSSKANQPLASRSQAAPASSSAASRGALSAAIPPPPVLSSPTPVTAATSSKPELSPTPPEPNLSRQTSVATVGPADIVVKSGVTSTPFVILTPPPVPGGDLFSDPMQQAYQTSTGFAPDARRVLDILSLQLSLERYKAARGYYPSSLQDLMPDYAPREGGVTLSILPVDPETHQPYTYRAMDKGAAYELWATTSTGKRYNGAPH